MMPNFERHMPPLPKTNSKRHMKNGENGGYQFRLLHRERFLFEQGLSYSDSFLNKVSSKNLDIEKRIYTLNWRSPSVWFSK